MYLRILVHIGGKSQQSQNPQSAGKGKHCKPQRLPMQLGNPPRTHILRFALQSKQGPKQTLGAARLKCYIPREKKHSEAQPRTFTDEDPKPKRRPKSRTRSSHGAPTGSVLASQVEPNGSPKAEQVIMIIRGISLPCQTRDFEGLC